MTELDEVREISTVKEWKRDGLDYHIAYIEWNAFMQKMGMHNHYNGYVTFPECPIDKDGWDNELIRDIDVHGGITYAVENEDGSYTYGFDCAHAFDDVDPEMRDLDWLSAECESMGQQITKAASAPPP